MSYQSPEEKVSQDLAKGLRGRAADETQDLILHLTKFRLNNVVPKLETDTLEVISALEKFYTALRNHR